MNFDKKAQEWDKSTQRLKRAEIIAKEINNFIKPNQKLNALEFGCGTGLLSFNLKNSFKTIFLADTSKGMIDVLKKKIEIQGIKNFIPLQTDLLSEKPQFPSIDVIYTLMTLHHIPDINHTFNILNSILTMNGYFCIADLVKEDGSFHSHIKDFDGHNGFEKEELSKMLNQSGFEVKYYSECFEIEVNEDGKNLKYPLFLMICRKIS
ncbi:MAG: class I SAM-dependent methyltransferase [Calditrichaeota bacterium]|nr:MAG: class I SAM-dependent methyltransferase [Calditrichota bacterium]